jgi:hypothetical protein
MSGLTEEQVAALSKSFTGLAQTLTREAQTSTATPDVERLTGMAGALRWAAMEVCVAAGIEPNFSPPIDDARTPEPTVLRAGNASKPPYLDGIHDRLTDAVALVSAAHFAID